MECYFNFCVCLCVVLFHFFLSIKVTTVWGGNSSRVTYMHQLSSSCCLCGWVVVCHYHVAYIVIVRAIIVLYFYLVYIFMLVWILFFKFNLVSTQTYEMKEKTNLPSKLLIVWKAQSLLPVIFIIFIIFSIFILLHLYLNFLYVFFFILLYCKELLICLKQLY